VDELEDVAASQIDLSSVQNDGTWGPVARTQTISCLKSPP
jgi:hypothetical protein